MVQVRAGEAGRELRVNATDGLAVWADRLRAEQAVGNLVDNALRHGDGPVELAAEPAGGGVRLPCWIAGPASSPPRRSRVRALHARRPRAHARRRHGLGLAIVDAIAVHGGRAGAGEREGGGADAWIELPESYVDFIQDA